MHLRKPEISDRGNILTFDKGLGPDLPLHLVR